jgi:hypothetical protein
VRSFHSAKVHPPDGIHARQNVEQVSEEYEEEESANQGEKLSRFLFPYHTYHQVKDALNAPFNEILKTRGDEIAFAGTKVQDDNQ